MTEERILLQPQPQLAPVLEEALGGDPLEEVAGEERRVRPSPWPSQHSRRAGPCGASHSGTMKAVSPSAKRPTATAACDPGAKPDMPMPGREPVEGLEHRAIGDRLEAPPLGLDICQIGVNAEVEIVRSLAPGLAAPRRCRQHHVRGRSRIPKRRQCRRACHNMH